MNCYICNKEIDPNNHDDFLEIRIHLERYPKPHRYDYDRIVTDYICPHCTPKVKRFLVHDIGK